MTTPLITTDKLTKRFRSWNGRGHDRYVTALKDCSLEVQAGEIFGLLGPNGAGKTTLLRLLMGFLKPSSGKALVDQKDCTSESIEVRRRIAYLPGDVRLFRNMNGHRFLKFMSELRSNTHRERSQQLADQLKLDLSRRVSNMSTGMKQKLALVGALATDAPLIILDEPTSNLDPTIRQKVLEIAAQLQAAGKTIVFSSHVLSEVEAISNRVAILRGGQLVHIQPMSDLKKRHRIQARLNSPLPELPAELQESVSIHQQPDQRVVIEVSGDFSNLLNWLAQASLSEMEISPVGLSTVYDQFHNTAI